MRTVTPKHNSQTELQSMHWVIKIYNENQIHELRQSLGSSWLKALNAECGNKLEIKPEL